MKTTLEYPLSIGQQGLWFFEQRFPKRGLYNVSAAWRLPENVSPEALGQAVARLSARHPAWQTTFSEQNGAPFQVVHEDLPPGFRQIGVPDTAGADFEKALEAEAARPLDLEKGPPARWVLFSAPGRRPVLLLVVHHMLVDGWSISTLLPDLGALYREAAGGPVAKLPPLRRGYDEFIRENTRWQSTPDGERERAFWDTALPKNIPPPDLPTDRPRRPVSSFDSQCLLFPLPSRLQQGMRQRARERGVRPMAAWLAAWFVFLYRLSGQEELLTRIPIAGRPPEYDGVLGFFVNTLPIAAHCSGQEGFGTLLGRVAHDLEAALAHRDWPFTLMVRELDRKSLSALLQNTFSWQRYDRFGQRASGLVRASGGAGDIWRVGEMDWELVRLPQQRDETDIQLQLINLPDGQYGALQYAADLFDRSTAERWIGHFTRLLEGIVAEPDRPISKLPLLTEVERRRILVEWNNTETPYPSDRCLHEAFQEQAAKTPDAVAVLFGDEQVSYGELNAHANRLAHRLRELGVGPEVLVGLCLERSVEMIVGLLAILKAGGAYVPLDPEYPRERLAFMAEDAGLKVLLCHGATRERLPECPGRILELDAQAEAIAEESTDNPPRLAGPENLAYVIYTSGSTGRPKGVMVEQEMAASHIRNVISLFGLKSEDRMLQFASLNFDASMDQIFGALAAGAGLVLRGEGLWTPEKCLRNIAHYGITVAHVMPLYAQQLLDATEKYAGKLNLRLLLAGGEALPPAAVRLWQNTRRHNGRFLNGYGPTEATVMATAFDIPADWPEDARNVPIGRPLPGRCAYILDPEREPLPIGIPGDLYLGGAGVARGYLNRPELTAEKFLPDPFRDTPGARMYRTGDRCRWLPDGTIEFLGRIDTQVKIRGFRIECGEIESVLRGEPGVREAVVDARGEGVNKRLVAWIVIARDGFSMLKPAMRAYLRALLRERLPDWMTPSAFVFVDHLPLTPSSKIDRRALPDPGEEASGPESDAEQKRDRPRGALEETLRGIFAQVLGIRRVGIHDDFFDLGGHSLSAMRVIAPLRERLGLDIPLRALFAHPTPAGLATVARGQGKWHPAIVFPLTEGARPDQPPLFCIHPVRGGAFCYRALADCLEGEWPVHGIQAVGFEGEATPLTDIRAMAARYVDEIMKSCPEGPYYLVPDRKT
uniref:Amino acid adenylation domain-containing protein n=1 Tax=Candidatus Kentrum sp. DK TaxID=2126562 RepID=A0A450T0M7_9GAMM|nr:MAG: amino acid adenylation domain-containing protein [Candidatus Kentron sp. DK]